MHKSSFLAIALFFSVPVCAEAQTLTTHTITVVGQAQILATPDYASIDIGVISSAKTVAAALRDNNAKMNRVVEAVAKLGIANEDVQTNNFNVSPLHPVRANGDEDESQTIGYQVTNKITITVRDIKKVAEVIDGTTQAGANSADSVVFDITDRTAKLDLAKAKAVEDARHQAEVMAAVEGLKVDKVLAITTNPNIFNEVYGAAAPQFVVRSNAPILPGQISISANIVVQFSLQ